MAKLTKGEKAGIRLIADAFVFEEVKTNVLAKDNLIGLNNIKKIEESVDKTAPKMAIARKELHKQIQQVRNEWLRSLQEEEHG